MTYKEVKWTCGPLCRLKPAFQAGGAIRGWVGLRRTPCAAPLVPVGNPAFQAVSTNVGRAPGGNSRHVRAAANAARRPQGPLRLAEQDRNLRPLLAGGPPRRVRRRLGPDAHHAAISTDADSGPLGRRVRSRGDRPPHPDSVSGPVTDRRVTLYRDTAGRAHATGLRRPRTDAAPAGYEWGYGGAGAAALARELLRAAGATAREADRWHRPFKWALIANLPLQGARLNLDAMRRTVNELRGRRLGTEDCVKELTAAAAPERLTEAHYRHHTPGRRSPRRITTRGHEPAGAAPINNASRRRGVRSMTWVGGAGSGRTPGSATGGPVELRDQRQGIRSITEEVRSIARAGWPRIRSITEEVRSISRVGWRRVRSIARRVRSMSRVGAGRSGR